MFGQILGDAFGIGFHPLFAFVPTGGTDFAVLVGEKHRIDHADHLIDVPAKRQVVDDGMADGTVLVDEEGSAQGDGIVDQDIVVPGDLLGKVGDQGITDAADTALLYRSLSPGEVAVLAVDGAADDIDAAVMELFEPMIEGDQLGGADEGEVQRIEEEDGALLSDILIEVEILDDGPVGQDGGSGEIRGFLVTII